MAADDRAPDVDQSEADHPDMEAVVGELRRRVAARRASGDYPPGLEERLARHFERVQAHRPDADRLKPVREAIDRLDAVSHFSPAQIDPTSRVPAGTYLHRIVGRAVSRQTIGILAQVQAYATALRQVLERLLERLDDPGAHTHADLLDEMDAALDRLAQLSTAGEGTTAAWYDTARFAERFWGPREEMLEEARELAALVTKGPALVLHAGRGELVEALNAQGVEATGVEPDPGLADIARSHAVAVHVGSPVSVLAGHPDRALGAVVLVGYPYARPASSGALPAQILVDAVAASSLKLRTGGQLIVGSLELSGAPVPRTQQADFVQFLCDEAGFANQDVVERPSGPVVVATL
jgi:hypothetical protein